MKIAQEDNFIKFKLKEMSIIFLIIMLFSGHFDQQRYIYFFY